MIVNLVAKDGTRTSLDLSNYATIQIRDELSRVPGVGDITYLGQRDYSMRLWLDPAKLSAYGLNAQDVILAVQAQNIQVAAGQIGQPPTPAGQVTQYIITTLGRLENTEQFANIVLKNVGSTLVRLKDVAGIELGAQSYDQNCTLDGNPSVALSVYQLPGSNALDVARRVKERMKVLKRRFPPGIDYDIVYDTTPFISESIIEVFKTLADAVMLVARRGAGVPPRTGARPSSRSWQCPVAVVGTFAVMAAIGFSLNNLTLFGLVLAIGIVVDDAIVVVEAVEHHIEHGLAPRAATLKAMEQVSGPVVAIGLVLSAVFIPCAFISGITGQFFRQFALTIAVSTVISTFNSLTLSPALSALLLKQRAKGHFETLPWFAYLPLGGWLGFKFGSPFAAPALAALNIRVAPEVLEANLLWGSIAAGAVLATLVGVVFSRPLNAILGTSFRLFNGVFDRATGGYTRTVSGLLRVSPLVLIVYAGLLVMTWYGFTTTPTGFIPQQDKGYLLVNVQLPDASSVGRTQDVVRQIERIALDTPGVKHSVAISGQSILLNANASNFGALYLMLDEFEKAHDARPLERRHRRRPRRPAPPRSPQGHRQHLRRPARRGLGDGGRLQDRRPGHRRQRHGGPPAHDGSGGSPPATTTPASSASSPVSGPTRRGSNSSSTAPRPRTGASPSTTSAPRSRPTSARTTSTTSTASAAPGRSTSRRGTCSAARSRT